ncbi:MAG TPA: ABC transporter substrate-binding protein [Burkholderiales bacterium]|nr:ABC transporter substrate-binding protein [Burkholderiales bacterium]
MLRTLLACALALAAPLAGAQGTIKIGVLGPMSQPQGEYHWFGAEMARDAINKAGGIDVGGKKMQIELVRADTNEHQSITDATNAIERVITRNKVDFLVGGFRSEAVLAMQEVAADYKKIFLGAGSAHPQLAQRVEQNYDRFKYWFRITPVNSTDLGRTLVGVLGSVAGQIRKELNKPSPRIAILAEKAIWNEPIIKAMPPVFQKMQMEVVGTWQPSALATDVTAELAAIDRAGADIIFTLLSGPVGITVGRQMGERNMKAVAFGINVEAQKEEFWQAAAGKANYVATLDTYAEVEMTPKTIPFVQGFRARFGRPPIYTAGTHDAIQLLKEAIEKAGTTDPDKLIPVMEKMSFVGAGGVIEFTKGHDPVWGIGKSTGIAVQWQNGKKVAFWPPQVKGMQAFKLP